MFNMKENLQGFDFSKSYLYLSHDLGEALAGPFLVGKTYLLVEDSK